MNAFCWCWPFIFWGGKLGRSIWQGFGSYVSEKAI